MLRLKTLGGLAVEGDQVPLVAASVRRHRLALLAFVAAAGPRGTSRDKLLAYFWPESDTGHARNCLKQAMFALRHELRHDLFAPGASVLRLDPHAIAVDCWEFEHALERRALRDAVDLYRGPFLDGFSLEGLAEFERWLERERARLANGYQVALETLVVHAEAAGDRLGALEWWERLAKHDPLSSRIALRLMQAMVATGDRVGALRYGELHARLLREELGTQPDTGERDFVAELREQVGLQG